MHISKLTLVNYRNFKNTSLQFHKGVNTIIGENGSGKSNILRATRLLLDDTMVRSAYRLDEADFSRSVGQWQGHWIIISMEFEEITTDESVQALFLHGTAPLDDGPIHKATYNLIFRPKKDIRLKLAALEVFEYEQLTEIRDAITIDDYETIFTGRSWADFGNPAVYKKIVGDFDNCDFSSETEFPEIGAKVPGFLSVTKEVSLTFIQALRDVVSEFHNNRTNPLFTLLKSKSGEINPATMEPITETVRKLNTSIEGLEDVKSVRNHIRETIKDAAGETYSPASLSIKSDLPEEADKLFQSLRLFVGESEEGYEGAIHELSLGGANLIYLTLKLLEFKYQREKLTMANFLLIEEPEAHIHTHIQKTLFDRIAYSDAQIIYTTHSTHISEVNNVCNINILGRHGSFCEAYQPAKGLNHSQINSIQRYLDAVRCNLLFAKSVLLVEGDVEEILIPILVKLVLGVSVDELGISVINIRSTGFKNVAVLFNNLRIKKRCAIITDLDQAFFDITKHATDTEALAKIKAKAAGSQKAGLERQADLSKFTAENPWLETFYAKHTFEVDFAAAGNYEAIVQTIPKVYKDEVTRDKAKQELQSGVLWQMGSRTLTMAKQEGKGWFALLLAEYLTPQAQIPVYIMQAIHFAYGTFPPHLLARILQHRAEYRYGSDVLNSPAKQEFLLEVDRFVQGDIGFAELKRVIGLMLLGDSIDAFIAGMQ